MKKLLAIVVLGLILFAESANAKRTKWVRGNVYENEVTWIKNTKIKLPPGEFRLMMSSQWTSWGIEINGQWLISTKGNLFHQSLSLNRIGSVKYLAYLKVIYEEIFFKNKYDGCYPRSEYTVMKLRRKGGFFNCFVVRHHDIQKLLYAPDDPQRATGELKYAIKKYGVELPRIVLCAETYFYAPSITETVLAIEYCINPETNGASKSEYTSEATSEYHPQNINKFPDKKKFMEEFIKIAAKRHKHFEQEINAKEKHKLDLSEYGVGEIIEETKTTNITSSSGLTEELKELHNLYKEGVLTKEEFEKVKKKVLSQ
jgi:hypothetical protein